MESSDHPVLAAIDARIAELGDRTDTLRESIAELEREVEALERGRALISEAASDSPTGAVEAKDDDPAPADPPRKPKRGRSSKGSARKGATPAGERHGPAPKDRSADRAGVLRWLRLIGEPCSLGQIRDSCDLSEYVIKKAIAELIDADEIVRTGSTSSTRYSLGKAEVLPAPEETRSPIDSGPGDRQKPTGANANGTLEGRILSALLTTRPTVTELEVALGVRRRDLDPALSRLMQDGDVRVMTEGDKRVLVGVP